MQHNNDIKELNMALKGEHMAIESFDHYIQDTGDPDLKKKLINIQQQHQFHAIQLSEKIHQLGGNPSNYSGFAGAMAEVFYKVTPHKYIDNNIVKTAVEGEEFGLQAYADIFSRLSDPANQRLTEELMIDNVRIVEQLNECK